MKKNNLKITSTVLCLTLLVLLPETAWAAEDIFHIIGSKLISTAEDVRRIVYVIAGFGLIMFTTMAIFNKISFKHLAYICISLFLLSVMMPFISYFSGVKLEYVSQMRWGDNTERSEGVNENDNMSSGRVCRPGECPDDPSGGGSGSGMPGLNTGLDAEAMRNGAQLDLSSSGALSEQTQIANCQRQSGMQWKNGQCVKKKGFMDTLRDIQKGAQQAANTVNNATSAINSAKQTVDNAINAPGRIIDAIGNIGSSGGIAGTLNDIAGAAGSIGSAAGGITSGVNSTISSAEGAMRGGGNLAGTITGNDYDANVKNSPIYDALEAARQGTNDVGGSITGVTSTTSGIANAGASTINAGERLGNAVGL